MAVRADISGLEKLRNDIAGIDTDSIIRGCTNRLMAELMKKVIKATPTSPNRNGYNIKVKRGKNKGLTIPVPPHRGGTLKRGWTTGQKNPSVVHYGNVYSVTVTNPTYYGDYVDKGHRQHKGMFVPAIGKRLKRTYVPGLHIVQKSEDTVQRAAYQFVARYTENAIKEVLKGDQ